MERVKLFFIWYKHLKEQGYNPIQSVTDAWHNSKYYDLEKKYRKGMNNG